MALARTSPERNASYISGDAPRKDVRITSFCAVVMLCEVAAATQKRAAMRRTYEIPYLPHPPRTIQLIRCTSRRANRDGRRKLHGTAPRNLMTHFRSGAPRKHSHEPNMPSTKWPRTAHIKPL